MAFNAFTSVRSDNNGMLLVAGKTDLDIDHVSAIHVAVIDAKNPERRMQVVVDGLMQGWSASAPNEAVGYGAFEIGERVVVVGAATHDLSSYPDPYLWEGTFTVEDENQPSSLPGIRDRDLGPPDPASLAPTS